MGEAGASANEAGSLGGVDKDNGASLLVNNVNGESPGVGGSTPFVVLRGVRRDVYIGVFEHELIL
jgi:hypothetical protein